MGEYDRDPISAELKRMNRGAVYTVIDSERDYQDAALGNARRVGEFEGKPLTPGEIILVMEKILADARDAWYKPDGPTFAAPFIRKVTAMGVQYMELYGAPRREGF